MPIGAITAGAAVLGAGASIYAGSKSAKAQKHAAEQGIAEQRREYDQTRSDLAPWRTAGGSALDMLSRAFGLNGQAPDRSAFTASPGYDFNYTQGLQAIDRGAAARGLLHSGAGVKAEQRFGAGLASNEYNNWVSQLSGIAGAGQNATNTTAQAGQNAANSITNAYTQQGNARASSYQNMGSSINTGINNVLSGYLYGKGGGFGGASGQAPSFGGSGNAPWYVGY